MVVDMQGGKEKAKQQFGTQITPNNIISENQFV